MRRSLPVTLLLGLALTAPLTGQSIMSGEVTGRITTAEFEAVAGVAVTLRSLDNGLAREGDSDLLGWFRFTNVAPGRYEIRAEAVGFRPIVVTDVTVSVGSVRSVEISVNRAPPPVESVDTLRLEAGPTRWMAGGPRAGARDLAVQRDLSGTLSVLPLLSPDLDREMGALGLPASFTSYLVDGVPFFRARHPGVRGDDLGSPALPTTFLAGAGLARRPSDVEFLIAGGASVSAESKAGLADGGTLLVEGAGSAGPLWSSRTLQVESPEVTAYRAAAQASVTLVPDTSRLYIAAEASVHDAPLQPRISADLADAVSGLGGELSDFLLLPSTETVTRFSALARLDRWSPSGRTALRASVGRVTREYDGAPPGVVGYGVAIPEETTEVSTGLILTSALSEGRSVEFTGGVSFSDRTFGNSEGPPPAGFVEAGIPLGLAAGAAAEATRVDAFVSSAFHVAMGPGQGKVGASFHATRHTISNPFAGGGNSFFSNLQGVTDGVGSFMDGTSVESSFSVPRMGIFGQYVWLPSPGIRVLVGARYDYEGLPTSDVRKNQEWEDASGLANDAFPKEFRLPAGMLSATWDVTGSGRTVLAGGGAVSYASFEPDILHEALTQDGASTVRRAVGSGLTWPAGGAPDSAVRGQVLTLLGPDTRPVRTAVFEGGLTQGLGAGWSLHVSGTARNTDFLVRRRDLNLPLYPLATDRDGRDVLGDLRKHGAVIAAAPGSERRFGGFDAVWALDPDGWSRYWGATAGLAHSSDGWDAYVAYTRSETRDNWVGASAGFHGAALDPRLPGIVGDDWSEGISDFDVPHRVVVGGTARLDLGGAEAVVSAVYTRHSGRPFTPRYPAGVDANGDGSSRNDVPFVPGIEEIAELTAEWPCLADQAGQFAVRNSCRGPDRSTLNASVRLDLASLGDRTVSITVEGFNLIEDAGGLLDEALVVVDPSADLERSSDGASLTIPVTVNPRFGRVLFPATRGRMLRVGLRVGG